MNLLKAMACWHQRRRISRWLDLSAQRRARVQTHSQECEACCHELEQMLQVHARLQQARQAYQSMTYPGPLPVTVEREDAVWRRWTGWNLAPVGVAVACLLGLMVLWQEPDSTGPKVSRASYRSMSVPPEMRPVMAVKVLPVLRKRAGLRLATPWVNKPKGVAFRYPKRPSRGPSMRRPYRARPS